MDRVNDFAFKIATANGTGSASANGLIMQSIFRMGVPVTGKNVFPSNIQGLPTWYEIRVNKNGYTARTAQFDLMVALNAATAWKEAQRCLNCDVQTVFTTSACIECDACVDICPMDCITFTGNGEETDLRQRLKAPSLNLAQDLYVSGELKTGHVMVKDEDVCLHCGLCAERCPTGAWDMQKYLITMASAGDGCRSRA